MFLRLLAPVLEPVLLIEGEILNIPTAATTIKANTSYTINLASQLALLMR